MVASPVIERTTGRTRVHQVSRETAVASLREKITRLERRYEMSSEQMLRCVQSGQRHDTAEIAEWLVMYRGLLRLTGQSATAAA